MAAQWDGPGVGKRPRVRFLWRHLVWALIYPQRDQQMVPTISGILLIALSLGIGTAAYNSSNNILFITLALMLACLILSGVLSWLNFSRLRWRIELPSAARAEQAVVVTLDLSNGKTLLPTYGLDCLVRARHGVDAEAARPETTLTGRGKDLKAIWKREPDEDTAHLRLQRRLDPRDSIPLDWNWTPLKRGRWLLGIRHVGSFFPFGFFNKRLTSHLERDMIVWPAPREYQWIQARGLKWSGGASHLNRAGQGTDLLALRRYESGDSHRLIHWKASARTRQLLVRQFSAEAIESYTLWLQTNRRDWERAEQFEVLVSFAATLGEDLFRTGRLAAVRINDEAPRRIRERRDLDDWLDTMAVLAPMEITATQTQDKALRPQRNTITFAADGQTGVVALIDGEKTATA